GAGDDVGVSVPVHVADGDINAAVELRVIRHEPLQLGPRLAVEDLYQRQAGGAGGGNNVRDTVAGDVAGGDADAPMVRRVVGQEAEFQLAGGGVVDVDHRLVAGFGADGDERGGDGRRRRRRGRIGGRGGRIRGRARFERVGNRRQRPVLQRQHLWPERQTAGQRLRGRTAGMTRGHRAVSDSGCPISTIRGG